MLAQIIKEIKNISLILPENLRICEQLLAKESLSLSRFFFSLLEEEIAVENGKKNIALILELVRITIDIHQKLSEKDSLYSTKQLILAGDHYFSQALCRIPLIRDKKIEQMIFDSITEVTKSDVLLGIWIAKKKKMNLRNYKKLCLKRDGALFTLALDLAFVLTGSHYQPRTIQKLGRQMGYVMNIDNEISEWKKVGKNYLNNGFVNFPRLVNQLSEKKSEKVKNIFNKKTLNSKINTDNFLVQKCENLLKNEKKILTDLLASLSLPRHFSPAIHSFLALV